MIRLTLNELYKIFHKKLLFVLILLAIGGTIFINSMDKLVSYNNDDLVIASDQKLMEIYESSGDNSSDEYLHLKSDKYARELIVEKKIEKDSPKEYLITSQIDPAYFTYLSESQKDPNSEATLLAKQRLDSLVASIDTYDWKAQINDLMTQAKSEDCAGDKKCELYKTKSIEIYEYRLKHNIPVSNNDASNELEGHLMYYREYLEVKDVDDKKLTYDKLVEKRNVIESYETVQYMLDNNLLENDYNVYGAGDDMLYKFQSPSFLVIILLLVLSGSIVAEEFNKGTIKQLLVKPFCRTKIVLSKMLAVIITVLLFYFLFNISSVVINGLFAGNLSDVLGSHVIYDFNANQCIQISYIKEALLSFVYVLPMLILLGIFVFAMGVLTTNTAFALGLGFGAYLSETIFQLFLERFSFLSYMPTLNYNLTTYMFGRINNYEVLTFNKAIIVDVVSFVVLFTLILIVFKKKDIKNQ